MIPAFFDEAVKLAGSALRSRIRIVQYAHSKAHPKGFKLMLGDREIGSATLKSKRPGGVPAQIQGIEIDPKFRGMGLGRKFYGELMRMMPGQTLASDVGVSSSAAGAWRSMQRRGTTVREALPNIKDVQGPQFIGSLPQAASKTPIPGILPVERTLGNTPAELALLKPGRLKALDRYLYGMQGKLQP